MRDHEFIIDELNRCNKCGYCMQSCPTYRATRHEANVARGCNHILRGLIEGETELAPQMVQPFFDCLLCGACTVDCLGSVQTNELMVRAREAYHEKYGQPPIQRYIFRQLLPHPDRLTRLARLLAFGKRSRLSSVARSLRVLRWISPSLEIAEGLVSTMPRRFLRDRLQGMGFARAQENETTLWRLEPQQATGPKVLYFIGCGTDYQVPHTGEAAIALLSKAGCQVTVAENNCCGLPPWSYGDIEAAKVLARQNLDLLEHLDFDLLVTECGSCSSFLKKYAELLPDDLRAADLVERTRDLTEILADLSLPTPAASGSVVTYHDPCHLVRGQGITEQPRKLLTDVGGFELAELPEADWCCGGAGSYNIAHPEMSLDVLDRKLDRINQTGAEAVATACPACIIQIDYGVRQRNWQRPVKHVAELLAQRQGL